MYRLADLHSSDWDGSLYSFLGRTLLRITATDRQSYPAGLKSSWLLLPLLHFSPPFLSNVLAALVQTVVETAIGMMRLPAFGGIVQTISLKNRLRSCDLRIVSGNCTGSPIGDSDILAVGSVVERLPGLVPFDGGAVNSLDIFRSGVMYV